MTTLLDKVEGKLGRRNLPVGLAIWAITVISVLVAARLLNPEFLPSIGLSPGWLFVCAASLTLLPVALVALSAVTCIITMVLIYSSALLFVLVSPKK